MSDQGDNTSASFGASVKVDVDIRTEVPPASSGRTLDALTDLIRPISESLGFLGDKIQLGRQKTLLEIAKLAKERIDASGKPTHPIPTKFFLPLLEKASLEDVTDDTLINMWANLMATAATEHVQMLGQYTNILSNIVSKQVHILYKMLDSKNDDTLYDGGHLIDNYYYLNQTGLPGTLDEHSTITDAEELADAIVSSLNIKGVAIDTISIFYTDQNLGEGFSLGSPDGVYSDEDFLDFENLVRLGLIDRTEIKRHKIGIFDIDVHYYVINPVGIDLFACCNPTKLTRPN
jgi:hypothetical protein